MSPRHWSSVLLLLLAGLQAQEHPERAGKPKGKPPRGEREAFELPEFTPVPAPPPSGLRGKQVFWFCMHPNSVVCYDPETDEITRRVELERGMFWRTTLTHDRRRLLVVTDRQRSIEVVSFDEARVLDVHTFAEDGYVLRIRSVRECPGGVCWLIQTDRIKKEIDRYSFEPARYLLYDSVAKKTLRTFEKLPEALGRDARLSADGTHWLSRDRDGNLLFLSARKLEELGRIDLETPRFYGAGSLRLMRTDLLDGRDPKHARMLFTSTDPIETKRTNWGVVDLDLEHRRIEKVTEWGPAVSSWGLRVATQKPVAALMSGGYGNRSRGDRRSHLMVYDLTTGERLAETYEEFRPRRSLVAISPTGDKLYIGTAGSDFEVFDADLNRLETVELDGEVWGRIYTIDA